MKKIWSSILAGMLLFGCFTAGACTNGGKTQMIPKENLLFYLNFDEEGKTVTDLSGNVEGELLVENIFNDAAFKESTPAVRREGVIGRALSFDGYSNFINTESAAGLDGTGSVSVSVWVAPRVWELPSDIFCPVVEYYDSGRDAGIIFGYSKYGTWGVRIKLGDRWVILRDGGNGLNLYEWTQIGFSYSSENGELALYKDGAKINSVEAPKERSRAFSTLKVGINTYDQTGKGLFKHNMFSGLMDELCIYGKALSDKEQADLFKRGLTKDGTKKPCSYEDVQTPASFLKDDYYKPAFHSSANVNWSSDPSGGFYYNGKYHQFYQSDDTGPIWRTFTWGHLVSDDMVNWYNVQPAIYAEDNTVDSYSTFAGSAIVAAGIPYLVYTGIAFNDPSGQSAKISFATPKDLSDPDLKEWKKLDALVYLPAGFVVGEYRDPFVYLEDGYAYMIVTASANTTGNIADGDPRMLCYRAREDDILHWEYLGVFFGLDYKTHKKTGFMWELPQLYKLTAPNGKTKYMYTCTPVGSTDVANVMYYWLGDFNKATGAFIPEQEEGTLLDNGSDVLCAGSGFVDPVSGQNMSTAVVQCVGQRSERDRFFSGWVGVYQLWRNYSLNNDGTLAVKFNDAYTKQHKDKLFELHKDTPVSAVDLSAIHERSMHITLKLKPNGAKKAGLSLLTNSYGTQGVSLWYEEENGRFVLDTILSKSEKLMRTYVPEPVRDGYIELDIYVDKSVVEFTVNHRYAFSARAFTDISADLVKAVGDGWIVSDMEIYSMKSIF